MTTTNEAMETIAISASKALRTRLPKTLFPDASSFCSKRALDNFETLKL
jgi:hypothetical protein